MKHRNPRWILGIVAVAGVFASKVLFAAATVTAIDLKGGSDPSVIEIQTEGEITYEKSDNVREKQIILDIKGARLSKKLLKRIDASATHSLVRLISPYQSKDQADTARIIFQLREVGTGEVTQIGNRLRLTVSSHRRTDTLVTKASAPADAVDSPTDAPPPVVDAESPPPSKADGEAARLDEFVANRSTKQFSGKPITLQVREVEALDVFRLIGEASGFNIILGDDVKGKITLSLIDVPWDQALDVVLHTLRLGIERNNNILRISTLTNLTTEKQDELKAQKAAEAATPRVTRVFPINYANLNDLQGTLVKFATTGGDSAAAAAVVQVDNRTNSLVVRDLPDNVERMKKLIEILDTQTPQVLIEAKIVEASEGFGKTITGGLGFSRLAGDTAHLGASFLGMNPLDGLIGNPGIFTNGADFGSSSSPSAGSFAVSLLPGSLRINALLKMTESDNQIKVVSSPKTVVINKEKATILQSTPVLVKTTAIAANGNLVPQEHIEQANLSLIVKPTVTNDGGVLMELTVTRDISFAVSTESSAVANRNLNTIVLVDSGNTLVIGGIYTMTTSHRANGFPILRKLPLIGWLFGTEIDTTDRTELFIFLTPKILNVKESGLSG